MRRIISFLLVFLLMINSVYIPNLLIKNNIKKVYAKNQKQEIQDTNDTYTGRIYKYVFEKKYIRNAGKPVTVKDSFITTPGEYIVEILNGENGKKRISSAVVTLNGTKILSNSDLNQNINGLNVPVTLSESNEISVKLNSKPNSFIIIRVGRLFNNAPVITSTAPLTGKEGTIYQYNVTAIDPDDDTLIYSLTSYPEGMTINSSTGEISWTPVRGQTGSIDVTVAVSDNNGETASQNFTIVVENLNNPPQITSTAELSGKIGELYVYNVTAQDPDNDVLTYSLEKFPEGMLIDETTGEINWTPKKEQMGTNDVSVKVSDIIGDSDTQEFEIYVGAIVQLDLTGDLKENRKVVLDLSESKFPSQYPIIENQTEWIFTPISDNLIQDDIKIDTESSTSLKKNLLFKKAGEYKVTVKVSNAKETITVERTMTIGIDEEPIVDFNISASSFLRDPTNNNNAKIEFSDTSEITDGDTIQKRIWKIKFDSNNNGSFDDEEFEIIDEQNNSNPSYITKNVGRYLVELEVVEGFGSDTIEKFINDTDYKKADTSSKPIETKTFIVDNTAPEATFEIEKQKK